MCIRMSHIGLGFIPECYGDPPDQDLSIRNNSGAAGLPSALSVEWDAFRGDDSGGGEGDGGPTLPWDTYHSGGTLVNKNTLDAFKQCDKERLSLGALNIASRFLPWCSKSPTFYLRRQPAGQ